MHFYLRLLNYYSFFVFQYIVINMFSYFFSTKLVIKTLHCNNFYSPLFRTLHTQKQLQQRAEKRTIFTSNMNTMIS